MLEQGTGRRTWRAKYPHEEWATYLRKQLDNGDRIALLRERQTAMSAVLTFFDRDGELHWVVHIHDYHPKAERMFDLLVAESERHPAPVDYSKHLNFGRF